MTDDELRSAVQSSRYLIDRVLEHDAHCASRMESRPLVVMTIPGHTAPWTITAEQHEKPLGVHTEETFPVPFIRADGTCFVRRLGGARLTATCVEAELAEMPECFYGPGEMVPPLTMSPAVKRRVFHRRNWHLVEPRRRLDSPGLGAMDAHYIGLWYEEEPGR